MGGGMYGNGGGGGYGGFNPQVIDTLLVWHCLYGMVYGPQNEDW